MKPLSVAWGRRLNLSGPQLLISEMKLGSLLIRDQMSLLGIVNELIDVEIFFNVYF